MDKPRGLQPPGQALFHFAPRKRAQIQSLLSNVIGDLLWCQAVDGFAASHAPSNFRRRNVRPVEIHRLNARAEFHLQPPHLFGKPVLAGPAHRGEGAQPRHLAKGSPLIHYAHRVRAHDVDPFHVGPPLMQRVQRIHGVGRSLAAHLLVRGHHARAILRGQPRHAKAVEAVDLAALVGRIARGEQQNFI